MSLPSASEPISRTDPFPSVPVTLPRSSSVPGVVAGTFLVRAVDADLVAPARSGRTRGAGELVGVLQLVLDDRGLALLRRDVQRALQPARRGSASRAAGRCGGRASAAPRASGRGRGSASSSASRRRRRRERPARTRSGRRASARRSCARRRGPCRASGRSPRRCGSGSSRPCAAAGRGRSGSSRARPSPSPSGSAAARSARQPWPRARARARRRRSPSTRRAGQSFSPIVFQTVALAVGGAPLSSMISQ